MFGCFCETVKEEIRAAVRVNRETTHRGEHLFKDGPNTPNIIPVRQVREAGVARGSPGSVGRITDHLTLLKANEIILACAGVAHNVLLNKISVVSISGSSDEHR